MLVLEAAETRLFEGGDQAVRDLLDVVMSGRDVDPTVVDALEEARRALGEEGRMVFRTPWRQAVCIDKEALESLSATHQTTDQDVTVSGWLHCADIDPDQIVIRDASGVEWTCHYAEGQESSVLSMIGSIVRAKGRGRSKGKRGRIEISSIDRIRSPVPVLDHRGTDATELTTRAMEQQGIASVQPIKAHALDLTPEEDAAFDAAIDELG